MSPASWPERLRASPELFPLDFAGPETVELVALSAADYERASFLDGRLARPTVATVAYAEAAAAAALLPVAADFIFHLGHVGSTLLSRLLGGHPAVFALREPQILRSFAEAAARRAPWVGEAYDARLRTFLALFSRTWRAEQRALVKATSFVGELADRILGLAPDARALLMTASPESYLATILGGPNSRRELTALAPGRLARLEGRVGEAPWTLQGLSVGELAAMSWASEASALARAAAAHSGRTAFLDFDRFLADPRLGLAWALRGLGRAAEPGRIEALLGSGHLERYSKAPEYAYGPQLRREVLDAARRDFGPEIRRGLAWLEAAADLPAIADALALAEGARDVA